MSKILPILLCLLFTGLPGYGQYALSLKKWIQKGDQAFQEHNYYGAYQYYGAAITYPKRPADLWFKYAEAARLFKAYPSASNGYEQTLASTDTSHHDEAVFWLAHIRQLTGDCPGAIDRYQQFLTEYGGVAPDSLRPLAEQGIRDCNLALANSFIDGERVLGDSAHHLSTDINTDYSEFGPVYRGDTLYYTSLRFEFRRDSRRYAKILRSVGGAPGEPLPAAINAEGKHNADLVFADDGATVYFSRCEYTAEGTIRCDLYRSRRTGPDSWEAAEPLSVNDPKYTTTQPAPGVLGNGTRVLFFSSDRPGGQGGLDLWYSPILPDGEIGRPVNLITVNTAGNEVSPSFHLPSRRLYFSSDRLPGRGGLDIFWTGQDASAAWSTPIGMPAPVNSSDDDAFYVRSNDGASAIFTSSRAGSYCIVPGDEALCYDLYTVEYDTKVDLQLTVANACPPFLPLPGATLTLYEWKPGLGSQRLTSQAGQSLQFPLVLYHTYIVVAEQGDRSAADTLLVREIPASGLLSADLRLPVLSNTGKLQVDVFGVVESQNQQRDTTALEGALVQLKKKQADGRFQPIDTLINAGGNTFAFDVERGAQYQLDVSRPLYSTDESYSELLQPFVAEPRMTLNECDWAIADNIHLLNQPIQVYFDNNVPGPPTRTATTTTVNYVETYRDYSKRKEDYIRQNRLILDRETFFRDSSLLVNFFDREVTEGYSRLIELTRQLEPYVRQGFQVKIGLYGLASPLGSAEYNNSLSMRRISSIINFLGDNEPGVDLKPYFSKELSFQRVALGEPEETRKIQDVASRRRADIFGVIPSLVRRVDIGRVDIFDLEGPQPLTSPDK